MNTKLPDKIEEILPKLDEKQLRLLNRIVVERLKLLSKARQLNAMSKFTTGDGVFFLHDGEEIYGRIIRLNQKTVSIITDDNYQWNVAPSLITLDTRGYQQEDFFEEEPVQEKNVTPFNRTSTKVGRNEPCPCGSGKKYKQCCGA